MQDRVGGDTPAKKNRKKNKLGGPGGVLDGVGVGGSKGNLSLERYGSLDMIDYQLSSSVEIPRVGFLEGRDASLKNEENIKIFQNFKLENLNDESLVNEGLTSKIYDNSPQRLTKQPEARNEMKSLAGAPMLLVSSFNSSVSQKSRLGEFSDQARSSLKIHSQRGMTPQPMLPNGKLCEYKEKNILTENLRPSTTDKARGRFLLENSSDEFSGENFSAKKSWSGSSGQKLGLAGGNFDFLKNIAGWTASEKLLGLLDCFENNKQDSWGGWQLRKEGNLGELVKFVTDEKWRFEIILSSIDRLLNSLKDNVGGGGMKKSEPGAGDRLSSRDECGVKNLRLNTKGVRCRDFNRTTSSFEASSGKICQSPKKLTERSNSTFEIGSKDLDLPGPVPPSCYHKKYSLSFFDFVKNKISNLKENKEKGSRLVA